MEDYLQLLIHIPVIYLGLKYLLQLNENKTYFFSMILFLFMPLTKIINLLIDENSIVIIGFIAMLIGCSIMFVKSSSSLNKDIWKVLTLAAIIFYLIPSLFKIMHWPGVGASLILSIFSIIFGLIVTFKKPEQLETKFINLILIYEIYGLVYGIISVLYS